MAIAPAYRVRGRVTTRVRVRVGVRVKARVRVRDRDRDRVRVRVKVRAKARVRLGLGLELGMAIAPGKGGKCFPRSVEVARQLAARAAVAGGAISFTISHTISRISRISPAREIGRDVEANRRREVQRRCEARNVEVKRLRRGERGRERAARLTRVRA